MTGANAILKCLELEGITTIFGYPGAAICPFYNTLRSGNINHVLVRHEQNAGHAANGYARITNRPAVCVATSGPGALNLITAIATAYMDSIPLVIITGQVSTDQIGRDVFQEADITGAAEPFVKHSYLIKDAVLLPKIFKEAFYISGSGRKGPVLIDVPIDIQLQEIDFSYDIKVDIRAYKPSSYGNSLQIKRAAVALSSAKKPLICVGGGVISANAIDEILDLAELINSPIVTTMMGNGAISWDNPLYLGMIGIFGKTRANNAVNKCDLLILVGARVGDRAVTSPSFLESMTKIIHIDIDPAEVGKNVKADIPIVGDAKLILNQIIEISAKSDHSEWISAMRSHKIAENQPCISGIDPRKFISKLSAELPQDIICVADIGQNLLWTVNNFKISTGKFLTSGGMGTMGYAIPAAIGAKIAAPEFPVLAICGDGAFQMQMMELATICENKIDIKIVIINNSQLGLVRELQDNEYGGNHAAVSFSGSPDFIKIAEAYSLQAERISDECQIADAISRLKSSKGAYILECIISPEMPSY